MVSGDQIVMDDTGRIYRNGALVIFCVYRLFRFLYKEISLKIAKISEETTKLSQERLDLDIPEDGMVEEIRQLQSTLKFSAASQENAAASEELATQAQLLKELIENFKVDE